MTAPTKSRAAGKITQTVNAASGVNQLGMNLDSSGSIHTFDEQTKFHPSESSIPPCVIEYRDFPERYVKLIAAKYGIAPATLIRRARKARVGGRRRGRRRQLKPSPMQLRMINQYEKWSGYKIARREGVSPQRVYYVLNRWKHLLPARTRIVEERPASSPVVRRREVRDTIVSFRLTARQAERVKELLGTLGLSRRVSNSRACRVVFLAMLGGYSPMAPIPAACSPVEIHTTPAIAD
jgi:hypothetical protein